MKIYAIIFGMICIVIVRMMIDLREKRIRNKPNIPPSTPTDHQ